MISKLGPVWSRHSLLYSLLEIIHLYSKACDCLPEAPFSSLTQRRACSFPYSHTLQHVLSAFVSRVKITKSLSQMSMSALQAILDNPRYHDYLAILKGARNGLVYGFKVRFPHALIMAILFGRGEYVRF